MFWHSMVEVIVPKQSNTPHKQHYNMKFVSHMMWHSQFVQKGKNYTFLFFVKKAILVQIHVKTILISTGHRLTFVE